MKFLRDEKGTVNYDWLLLFLSTSLILVIASPNIILRVLGVVMFVVVLRWGLKKLDNIDEEEVKEK